MEFDVKLKLDDFYYDSNLLTFTAKIYKESSENGEFWDSEEYIIDEIGEIDALVSTPSFNERETFVKLNSYSYDTYELFEKIKSLKNEKGMLGKHYNIMVNESFCFLDHISIDAEERNNGYGRESLKQFSNILRGFGVASIYLFSKAPTMNKFYKNNGFDEVCKVYDDENKWHLTLMHKEM